MKNFAKSGSYLLRVCSVILLSAILFLVGCATPGVPDPYENYNRKMFVFNQGVDKAVYRPIAKVYDTVTPGVVQKSVTNFFLNLAQPVIIANDFLQGNMEWFVSDIGRLIVNTTLGVGGLFDVASSAGIEKHRQDFGLTLAKWGVRESPYLLVPFLPPTTSRDLFGMGVDYYAGITTYFDFGWITYAALGLSFVNDRASVLGADKLIEQSFDPYVFVRDAYLQRRQSQIQRVLDPHGEADDLSGENFIPSSPDEASSAEDSGKVGVSRDGNNVAIAQNEGTPVESTDTSQTSTTVGVEASVPSIKE